MLSPFRVLAFDYFEHRYLGNEAYDSVTKDRCSWDEPFKTNLREAEKYLGFGDTEYKYESQLCKGRLGSLKPSKPPVDFEGDGKDLLALQEVLMLDRIPVGFGDLAALAGDHVPIVAGDAVDSKDLGNMVKMVEAFADPLRKDREHQRILVTRRHWVHACRWYRQSISGSKSDRQPLNTCFRDPDPLRVEMVYSSSEPGATEGYVPSRLELAEFERLDDYVGLAGSNKNHFPMHSWKTYIDHHMAALTKAAKYAQGIGMKSVQTLKEALIHEGIAQHFLQDSFAGGHIASPYGSCKHVPWLNYFPRLDIEFLCVPSKRELQHGHDYLNGLGVAVCSSLGDKPLGEQSDDSAKCDPAQKSTSAWRAFGDRHLFIPEADKHRAILKKWTAASLEAVLQVARNQNTPTPTRATVCAQWLTVFPITKTSQVSKTLLEDCAYGKWSTHDLSVWEKGRASDPQVPGLHMEGWKFSVTAGNLLGTFTHLNEDGSSRAPRGSVTAFTFDIGYVRSTDLWKPNYVGSGIVIAPGNRMSIYPASVGYWGDVCEWLLDKKGLCFAGIRANAGVRLIEPFSAENRTTHRNDILEVNVPFDFGIMVYPPVAIYLRAELLTIGCPTPTDPSSWGVDSIFVGRGAITGGVSFDLAGILQ